MKIAEIEQELTKAAAYRAASRVKGLPREEAERLENLDEETAGKVLAQMSATDWCKLSELISGEADKGQFTLLYSIRTGYAYLKRKENGN